MRGVYWVTFPNALHSTHDALYTLHNAPKVFSQIHKARYWITVRYSIPHSVLALRAVRWCLLDFKHQPENTLEAQ